ncbi:MAG: hypothetical protein Q9191_002248 [Dirinaria sp. TL-2023a]
MISKYEKTKGLIPKTPLAKFDWCASAITLALLGSRWRIAPKILFPLNEGWDEFWFDSSETRPVVLEKDQTVNSMGSLRLPSKRTTASKISNILSDLIPTLGRVVDIDSTNEDRIVIETLYLATTIAPPQLDEHLVNAFKSHYYSPDYHFLRLIRVSRAMNSGQTIDKYVVLCDSQELRATLRDFVMSRSFFDNGSLNESEAISRGEFPILLVRYFKQYVIHQLCHNLDRLKTNLEEAKYEGRKDPSYSKLNYVLHLRDHLEMTECFLSYLAGQFPTLPDFSKLNQTDPWPATFKSDQEYLRAAIVSLEKELRQVYETIKMQIESKNGSRNTLFAIVASFYLPFSLATGALGMNIKEINGGKPKWSAVLALGLPLAVVTVALPLGFGYGYRKSREFAAQNPKLLRSLTWAILFLGVGIPVFFCSQDFATHMHTPASVKSQLRSMTMKVAIGGGYGKDQPWGFSNCIEKVAIVGVLRVVEFGYSSDDETAKVEALRGQQVSIITMAVTAPNDTTSKRVCAAARAGICGGLPSL